MNANGTAQSTGNKLLSLSNDELEDALRVLSDGPLGNLDTHASGLILVGLISNELAILTGNSFIRHLLIEIATASLEEADASLGTGTGFTMGAGNLLF